MKFVYVGPGATQLILTPELATSKATHFVNIYKPAFDIQ